MSKSIIAQYAERGWYVFPVKVSRGQDGKVSKEPLTQHGHNDSSNSEEQIAQWQHLFNPLSWGLDCGKSGVVVIDVDIGSEWADSYPHAPTLTSLTGSGGTHHIYKAVAGEDIRNSVSKIAHKVDVRANGGYIVIPPSHYIEDKKYKWLQRSPIQPLPAVLLELILSKQSIIPAHPPTITNFHNATNPNLSKATKELLAHGAPEGQRNSALFSAACDMAGNSIPQVEAEALLSVAIGLPPNEVKRTVASAYNRHRVPARPPLPSARRPYRENMQEAAISDEELALRIYETFTHIDEGDHQFNQWQHWQREYELRVDLRRVNEQG